MGEDTQKLDRKDPVRAWVERQLGRSLFFLIPGLFLTFAGWIYAIGTDITELKSSIKQSSEKWEEFTAKLEEDKENQAQWNALLRVEEKSKNLEIEVELYKRMFYLMVEKDVDPELFRLERVFPRPEREFDGKENHVEAMDEDGPRPKPTVKPFRPIKILPPRNERLKEFKQEQIEQIQRQQHYPNKPLKKGD